MDKNLPPSRSQAYLNEYKGNLFEYLVAHELAQKFQLQSQFTESLGENQWNLLTHYEREMRKLDPTLAQTLPLLAQQTAQRYEEILAPNCSITHIELRGKPMALGGQARQDEADISITIDGSPQSISLKLGKAGSFINTKSAGIKSFISEYFASFNPEWEQQELNRCLEDSHQQMGEELYQQRQLHFHGEWDERWTQLGLSELPGELPQDLRPIVHAHYQRVMAKLHSILWHFYERNPENFKRDLLPLLGFTQELTQIKVYHRDHCLHSISILNRDSLYQHLDSIQWRSPSKAHGLFHIEFSQHCFQLRLKPMNVFTVPALKVNCSVKWPGGPGVAPPASLC